MVEWISETLYYISVLPCPCKAFAPSTLPEGFKIENVSAVTKISM